MSNELSSKHKKHKYVIFTEQQLLDLVLDAKCGDQDSLELIINAYEPYIIKLCRDFNDTDPDDLIQQIRLGIEDGVKYYKAGSHIPVSKYIKITIRNRVVNYFESKSKEVDADIEFTDYEELVDYESTSTGFEDDICDLQDIYAIVKDFRPKDKMAILLYCEGYSLTHIARVIGLSEYYVYFYFPNLIDKIKTKLYQQEYS